MTPAEKALFYTFLAIFAATATVALLGLIHVFDIQPDYQKALFGFLLLEVVGTVVGAYNRFIAGAPVPPISGKWEYRCAKGHNYEHGGVCTIKDVERTRYGVNFKIHGQRQWVREHAGGPTKKLALNWESSWASVTGPDYVRFTYSVEGVETTVDRASFEAAVEGYAWAHIEAGQGDPESMNGNFYQLPPFFSLQGRLEFTRMRSEADTSWGPE